jgi:Ni2+-binding GTPase involved in maturation of urease and hydrogenase
VGIEDLPKRVTVLPADVAAGEGLHRTAVAMKAAMNVVGFAGYSGSGKTTLVESSSLRCACAGLRVSVVKHAHHQFDIDHPGKDSFRHRQAGAFEVVVASAGGWR